jgi:hypothetical protein
MVMLDPEQHWNARQDGEQEAEETHPTPPGGAASEHPGEQGARHAGKASTALPEGIVGRATDTIEDGEGHYLEPPD